jgi:membrane protein YdbS with pleckstrin-like domain
MDYQITCVCGHRFLVPQDKVTGIITCPACQQRLSPVIEASPAPAPAALLAASDPSSPQSPAALDAPPVSTSAEPTKRCPYCGEVILAVARKCKHCGEFLDREPPAAAPLTNAAGRTAPPPVPPDPAQDTPTFALSVSQWDNFWKFLITLTIAVAIAAAFALVAPLKTYRVPAIMGIFVLTMVILWYFYLAAKHTRVYVRPLRIDTERGILSKDLNSLDLFRVTHLDLKQGLIERLLGIGTITLTTADPEEPDLALYQIPHVRKVYQYIQTQIPIAARQRGALYMEK